MNAPCKDCSSRRPACHDKCGLYQEWLEVEHKKKEHVVNPTEVEINKFHIGNIIRTKKRYNNP